MSAGKIPDAREEAARFRKAKGWKLDEAHFAVYLADFQKRTLLAAADIARGKPKQFLTPEELERLAEEIGRQG